jgi:hypothetical protein
LTQRLNITNGDSAAGTLSEAGVEGKIISWRDVLHEGPVDSSLSLEELSKGRARFISEQGWDDFAHVSGDFAERDRVIRHLDYFDEVVLWFEDDLYDQLQLIQLLDFFGRGAARGKTLSVIVVDGYIPPLSTDEIKRLDKVRQRVTAEQLELAKRAWKAFGSEDPTSISKLLDEREALSAIQAGHTTPVAAFLEVARRQESIFLGDIIFYSYLERLSGRTNALITWKDGTPVIAPSSERSRQFVEGELTLTPLGREVLAGRQDWQRIHNRTRWLGGVEIRPGEGSWRWDPSNRELVRGGTATKPAAREARPRKATAKKPTTKKPTTKKSATKKSATKKSTRKSATKKTAAKKSIPKKRKK